MVRRTSHIVTRWVHCLSCFVWRPPHGVSTFICSSSAWCHSWKIFQPFIIFQHCDELPHWSNNVRAYLKRKHSWKTDWTWGITSWPRPPPVTQPWICSCGGYVKGYFYRTSVVDIATFMQEYRRNLKCGERNVDLYVGRTGLSGLNVIRGASGSHVDLD